MANTENSINGTLQTLETPDKSENDKKNYRYLILPNGLKLLLVSDPKTGCKTVEENSQLLDNKPPQHADEKLSAVALMVDVGAFSQPRDYQGLAHFLEHMLFMGSTKYPLENSFDKHLTKYGGCNNAMTDSEITVYYFEVPEQHLDSSMEHLVAQLKEPLLLEDSMTRERQAVESEYQLVVNNDDVRRYQLMQSMASENFPHSTFTWGNLKSLKEDVESEQALNKSLREFYQHHYSAHRMFCCIQSPLPLDDLQELALKHLHDVRNNNLNGLDFKLYKYREAFKKEFFEEVFFIKPISDVNILELCWVMPPTLEFYKCKPEDFLSHLLGYEGEGSLCAYLRKKLWALQLTAGADACPMFTLFYINITLTELGFSKLDDVLAATFAFVKLYHSASELKEIYEELSFIKNSHFRYASEISPMENVQYLVKSCKYYPSKDILTGSQFYYQFDEQQLQILLQHLNEFHFNISITSKLSYEDVVYDKKEKWFGTEYATRNMPTKWLDLWNNNANIKELYLPHKNPFVAKNFHIFCKEKCTKDMPDAPEKLLHTDVCELWFRQDDRFLLPHGYMYFYFISPLLKKSGRNSVICALYLDLVQHHLVEELYAANVAGINYNIYCSEKGVVLGVDGYNEKLYLVVEIIMKGLISIRERIQEDELETFKKQHQKNYFNALIKPETVNGDLLAYLTKDLHCLLSDRFKLIKEITLEELQQFAKEFYQELYVQCLIQGNLEKEIALQVTKTVMDNLKCNKIKERYFVEDRAMEIPLGSQKILCLNLNPKDCNTVVKNLYQVGPRVLRQECIISLLMMILEAPVYDVLRTKEQLGYCVSCSMDITHGVMGYNIYVCSQETKHSHFDVEERIEAFREGITKLLEQLPLEDFKNFKNSLIKLKEIKDITLYDEVSRNWSEITSEEYIFDRKSKEIVVIHSLEKEDILDFWLRNEEKNLRKLTVQVIGTNKEDDKEKDSIELDTKHLNIQYLANDKNGEAIQNIGEFKEKLQVYPVIKTEI